MPLLQIVTVFAFFVFLALLAAADTLGFTIGVGYFIGAMLAAPLLSAAVLFGMIWVVDWSECNARTRRIAKAKARKLKEGQ
ncbi:hypothetical protein [Aeromonas dhakensis]|uniref:hypothetical protein n=1 Tax=Aeromonas dhakensis TaxID=196024 RepID=UPI000C0BE5B8|nr:hypothetical protein [Aeromonas dhakensis]MDH0349088.1 hypothetical protein [Aeromonas dhakensis]PHS84377.1 hypothetical protein AAW03_18270 [Aeromonas dhakensis]PHS88512.1 hypothetical protein AAW02_11545 [Aeromonas dhakensis]